MTFWNLHGFQGCRYFQLYQPWLSQLSAWYWVAKLELPVLAWPFKPTIVCCHSKLSFLFLHYFVILLLLLNDKGVILSIQWHFFYMKILHWYGSKPNTDRGLEINVYYIYKQCFFNYWKGYLNFVAIRTIIIWHYFCNGQFEIWEMSKFYNCTFIIASVYAIMYSQPSTVPRI